MEKQIVTTKKILVPTDYSEVSSMALPYAAAEARNSTAMIELLHVVEEPLLPLSCAGEPPASRALDEWRSLNEGAAIERLHALVHTHFSGQSVPIKLLQYAGSAAAGIVDYARDGGFEMIIMASHGYGLFTRTVIGSVAERVLRRATCPVLVVPCRHIHQQLSGEPEYLPYKKIAVTTDFSPASRSAFTCARNEAQRAGASLVLIHVLEQLYAPELLLVDAKTPIPEVLEIQANYRKHAHEQLLALTKEPELGKAQGVLLDKTYSVVNAINEYVAENEIDLLVIATRGAGSRPYWIGGVVEGLVRHVDCPILAVPPDPRC